jgi:hypothetical protein
MRAAHRERHVGDELAARHVVAEGVELQDLPDDAAIAQDQVAVRVPDRERLARVDAREFEDGPFDVRRLGLLEQPVSGDVEPLAGVAPRPRLLERVVVVEEEGGFKIAFADADLGDALGMPREPRDGGPDPECRLERVPAPDLRACASSPPSGDISPGDIYGEGEDASRLQYRIL